MSFNKTQLKKEYLTTLRVLGLAPHNVIVSAGGALVMHGIRETTNDLDLDTDSIRYDIMAERYPAIDDGFPRLSITPNADLHRVDNTLITSLCVIQGVWCYSLTHLLGVYKALSEHPSRKPEKVPRDLETIAAIQKALTFS